MNTSMTINATAMWLLALYQVAAEEQAEAAGEDPASAVQRAGRHDAERHHQGVPVARHLRLRAGPLAAADHRHGRLHGRRDPEVEPDQHLQLPPAGGRRDAGAGDRVRDVHRDRRARCRARLRPGASRALRRGRRPHLLLRQRRRALRRGDVQDARLRAALGRADPRALRRHRRQAAPLPLRRAGQLARAHRGPAREQRAAHRARDARRHAVQGRPGPRGAAAGLERGARPAAPVGPAVVAAHPAGARLRERPARVRRPLRGLGRRRGQGRRARRGRPRRDRPRAGDGRRRGRRRGRLHEERARRVARAPAPADRGGRGRRRRRQPLRDHRAQPAHRRPRHRDPGRRRRCRGRRRGAPSGAGARSATRDPERRERAASALARLRRGRRHATPT